MRIAYVVSAYHPHLGGVETHVRRLAEGCAASGDDVMVLTHRTNGLARSESIGPVRVRRFPLTVRSAAYPVSLAMFGYLRRRARDFDLVHAHSYHTLAAQAAVHAGMPFVFTPHYHGTGHTGFTAALHQAYRPAGARLFAAAEAVICVSDAERVRLVEDFPLVADRVTTIPNGTDRHARTTCPDEASGRTPVVLTVGRLERYKNVDLIIRAFRAMETAATLVIVGDGPDRSRLERLAGLPGGPGWPIRFAGRIPDEDLARLLTQASVVTSASDHEAFGLVVADGLACGARAVVSGIPAHREVGSLAGPHAPVDFVDPRDTRQFALALSAAIESGPARNASVQLPSWADVVGRTRELYAKVRAGRYGARRSEFA
jgi:glycosyltransferase involved in cell wall biosynthesis